VSEGKIIYDTSVYIEFLRSKSFANSFRSLYEVNIPVTFFCSVVVQELIAGATDQLKRAAVEGLYRPFERSRRIVTPTHAAWREAGRLLATMRVKRSDRKDRLTGSFINDLLIALSARSVGASVVTLNADDFTMISKFTAVQLEILNPSGGLKVGARSN
jgi:predicted nucleic acid-binding protein